MNFSGKQESKPLVLYKLNCDTAPNKPFMKKGKCYVIDKCLPSYHARDKVHIILCTRYRTFASAGYNI